jgi:ELWxxDGT repeat protein
MPIGEGMIAIGGELYFCANDGVHGYELWKTDGTSEGTVLVADIAEGIFSSSPAHLAAANGMLFFRASDGISGEEPWVHLPSLGATFLLQDIAPGIASSHAWDFTPSSRGVFFAADDGTTGTELWLLPGAVSAEPRNAVPAILELTFAPDPVQMGSEVSLSAAFRDGDWYSYAGGESYAHGAVVDWDGSGVTGPATVEQTPGGGIIKDSHVYAEPGTYTVVVRVSDHLGEEAMASGSLVVTVERVPAAVRDLDCHRVPAGVTLTWTNRASDYDAIEIRRDGGLLASLPGDSESFTDTSVAASVYSYAVTSLYAGVPALSSPGCTVETMSTLFVRGETNADGEVDLSDAVATLKYLFTGGTTPGCLDAADADDNDVVDMSDAIRLLKYLFGGLAPPPAPFPDCSSEPDPDDGLSCERHVPCGL